MVTQLICSTCSLESRHAAHVAVIGGPEATSEGSEDSDAMAPSASEISESAEDVDPSVQLYNQRLRRPPVFPVSKLMQRVSLCAQQSSVSASGGMQAGLQEFMANPMLPCGLSSVQSAAAAYSGMCWYWLGRRQVWAGKLRLSHSGACGTEKAGCLQPRQLMCLL